MSSKRRKVIVKEREIYVGVNKFFSGGMMLAIANKQLLLVVAAAYVSIQRRGVRPRRYVAKLRLSDYIIFSLFVVVLAAEK